MKWLFQHSQSSSYVGTLSRAFFGGIRLKACCFRGFRPTCKPIDQDPFTWADGLSRKQSDAMLLWGDDNLWSGDDHSFEVKNN